MGITIQKSTENLLGERHRVSMPVGEMGVDYTPFVTHQTSTASFLHMLTGSIAEIAATAEAAHSLHAFGHSRQSSPGRLAQAAASFEKGLAIASTERLTNENKRAIYEAAEGAELLTAWFTDAAKAHPAPKHSTQHQDFTTHLRGYATT
ncbi:MAG: hypothetical protein K2Q01_07240, partial [Rickettsiales bacterium]|nr:hypothetical protein [Rickettsiales bacterium]